jgi:hypothetical protein
VTKKRRRPIGETIGGILVGFDQQVFRTLPPPHDLVQKSKPVRGLSGQDDGLEVVFPDDDVEPGRGAMPELDARGPDDDV